MQKNDLVVQITLYLSNGGLFNPELANHVAVRDLLIQCKEALAQPEQNQFKPDWDAMAVMVEEQQRMAKRIEDLETEQDCVGWFGYDTGLRLWFETNEGDDGAIPLYKRRRTHD